MAGQVRSLFESGDGLELALDAKRREAIAAADQFDHLLGYLAGWEVEPLVATAGGEQLHQYGGSGTPRVAEFAVCEIAGALDLSPTAGAGLVADILDLEHRLPRLYACLHAGTVEAWRVRIRPVGDGLSELYGLVSDVDGA